MLKAYLGENPPPRYRPPLSPRFCVVVGTDNLSEPLQAGLLETLSELDYDPQTSGVSDQSLNERMEASEMLASADLELAPIGE
jgi:hypothetical protein